MPTARPGCSTGSRSSAASESDMGKMMPRFSRASAACFGLVLLGACASRQAAPLPEHGLAQGRPQVEGCPYISVPKDSLVIKGNHHLPDAVYWPRSLEKTYTGCVYFWQGPSRLYSIARFRQGSLVDGVIQDIVDSVFDDSDLPPMVYCKAQDHPPESGDCARFSEGWRSWLENFSAFTNRSN